MANDTTIRLNQPAFTGLTLYVKVENSAGLVCNGTGSLVAYVLANLKTYAIAFPESPAGSGRFSLNFSTLSLPANDTYAVQICICAGGAPVGTNASIADATAGNFADYWDGTQFGAVPGVSGNVAGSVGSVLGGVPANVIHSGTAQGGTASTITLDAGASSIDNTYQMNLVYLSGGTGAGQTAVILYGGYAGSTRVAAISTNWATIPDATTTFQVLPQGAVVVGAVGGAPRTVNQDFNGTGSLAVTDADGNPIAGAAVTAYLASAFATQGTAATPIAATTTDALGRWTLPLSPSAYTLVFAYAGEESSLDIVVN